MPVLQLPSSPKATFSINSQKNSPSLGTMEQGNKTNQISLLMFVKSSMVAIQCPFKAQPHSVRTSKSGICADLYDSVCYDSDAYSTLVVRYFDYHPYLYCFH